MLELKIAKDYIEIQDLNFLEYYFYYACQEE